MTDFSDNDDAGVWDDFLGGRVKLYQTKASYRATSDAVLLAAAVNARKGDKILDAGCGTGAVALCLHRRCPDTFVTGADIQDEMLSLMRKNVAYNRKEDFIGVVKADICDKKNGLPRGAFDWVVTNPPFILENQASPNAVRDTAHRESGTDLKNWIEACLKYLKPAGRFAMINRADRLPEILSLLYGALGGLEIVPVYTKRGFPAKRVIVTGRKSSKSPAVLCGGVVLNSENGERTALAEAVMRGGEAIHGAVL